MNDAEMKHWIDHAPLQELVKKIREPKSSPWRKGEVGDYLLKAASRRLKEKATPPRE